MLLKALLPLLWLLLWLVLPLLFLLVLLLLLFWESCRFVPLFLSLEPLLLLSLRLRFDPLLLLFVAWNNNFEVLGVDKLVNWFTRCSTRRLTIVGCGNLTLLELANSLFLCSRNSEHSSASSESPMVEALEFSLPLTLK